MFQNLVLATTLMAVAMSSDVSPDFSYDAPTYPYRPKLISQEVQLKHLPVKVIKITRTVAVKVPQAYPVKIPYHIPIPVPVHHPVAVPVPQIVKVPHHVPVPVPRPFPVELPQQVPVYVGKPVHVPHPVPVPHPVAINRPVYVHVTKPLPYPVHHHDHNEHLHHQLWDQLTPLGSFPAQQYDDPSLYTRTSDFEATNEGNENTQGADDQSSGAQDAEASSHYFGNFRPSQPDYASPEQ